MLVLTKVMPDLAGKHKGEVGSGSFQRRAKSEAIGKVDLSCCPSTSSDTPTTASARFPIAPSAPIV
jgi:hypothetical protein